MVMFLKRCVCLISRSMYTHSCHPVPYKCPDWARGLDRIPSHKVELGHLDTPIHKWNLPELPDGISVFIKRDDMTGSTLSGNKVRKLEFILADAIQKKCRHIITCGGLQSNFCRAAAVAATQLGLKTHVVLRSDIKEVSEVGCNGNVFLDRLCEAELYVVPRKARYVTHLLPVMQQIAVEIKSNCGEESYIVPVGGSSVAGMFGYLQGFDELIKQKVLENFDDIVFTCGSGGTAAGLAIGNFLTGQKVKIHAVTVSDNAEYFHDHVNEVIREVGLKVNSEDILDVIDGHKGRGYGLSSPDELDFIFEVSRRTGIMLDPVYTGKGAKGMMAELRTTPERFQGSHVLFIHTGGVFGMYEGTLNDFLLRKTADKVHIWTNPLPES